MPPRATEQSSLNRGARDLAGITDTEVRHGFIRKVFGILGVQLVVTTAIAALIMIYGESLMSTNPALVTTLTVFSLVATIGMMLVFLCCPDTMRRTPTNYILLSVFTVAEAVLVGFVCVQYTVQSVLVVLAITAFIVLSLMLFACQTKYDFTGLMPYFFAASMCLLGFGLVLSLVGMFGAGDSAAFETLNLIYAALGALLFSGYIVLDTQLIVGGKHSKHRFTLDDYCMAAINIYLDIVNLFLFLLELFGKRR